MISQTMRFLVPVVLIGLAMLLACFNLFSSTAAALIALLATIVIALLWRRFVFSSVSTDYEIRMEAATDSVRLSATRWTSIVFVLTYFILLICFGLAYFLGESWVTFALIVMIVGLIAKVPYSVLATDWTLQRMDRISKRA